VLGLFYPPTQESRRARQELARDYVYHPQASTDILLFNTAKAPLDDAFLRQALATSIYREELAYNVVEGYAVPTHAGVVSPSIPGHLPQNPLSFDPQRARMLLAQSSRDTLSAPIEFAIATILQPVAFGQIGSQKCEKWGNIEVE